MLGFPKEIRTNGSPGFRGRVHEPMHRLGITHNYSAPYVTSSNGLAERAIVQIKTYLSKLGQMKEPNLQSLLFPLNKTPSSVVGAGTAFQRFYDREGRSTLPSLPKKYTNEKVRLMKIKREKVQS